MRVGQKRTSITISESIGNPYLKPNDTNSIRNPWSPFDLNDSLIFSRNCRGVNVVVSMITEAWAFKSSSIARSLRILQ